MATQHLMTSAHGYKTDLPRSPDTSPSPTSRALDESKTNMPSSRDRTGLGLMTFPRSGMDFGEAADVSTTDNELLRMGAEKNVNRWRKPPYWLEATSEQRTRTLNETNRLGQSETHLGDIKDAEAFWTEVLKLAPPKQWTDKAKVLEYLADARPLEEALKGNLLSRALNWLSDAIQQGSRHGWSDDMLMDMPRTSAEEWDAIRIIGDSREGFGTYPRTIRDRMANAGFTWIAVDPRKRIIPKCWVRWARINKLAYKGTVALDVNPHADIKPTKTSPTSNVPSTRLPKDINTPNANGQQGHAPGISHAKVMVKSLEKYNGQLPAKQASSFHIHQPQEAIRETPTWQAVDLNINEINNNLTQIRKEIMEQTHDCVKMIIKEAIVGGSIEAKVREVLGEALHGIRQAMWRITTDQEVKIQQLEHEVSQLKDQKIQCQKRPSSDTEDSKQIAVNDAQAANGPVAKAKRRRF
ncbi:hypothetical protein F4861DRAFT_534977 [Xylaria intraflava]|nr:hypothetical protein F4861DRAFT_534977 [Xylaria intraflava]